MSMPEHVMRYQSNLLRELVEEAETESKLSSAEAETLHQRIKAVTTEQDIAAVWAEFDEQFWILDED